MALTTWEPMYEVETLRRQMERMFEQMMGRGWRGMGETLLPPMEIYQTDRDMVINVELPGLDPKDVTVEITEDSVLLSGETKRDQEIKEDRYYRSARTFGQFKRSIALPEAIKDQEAKATFKNGLLTIRAPLAHVQKRPAPHKITIEA